MAPAGCRTHRHASRELITKHDHLIHHIYSNHILAIPHHMPLQNKVRRPLLCCCKFYVASTGNALRSNLTYEKPQRGYSSCLLTFRGDYSRKIKHLSSLLINFVQRVNPV
jgi:hypothetical protein